MSFKRERERQRETERDRERERKMFYLTTHSTHFIYGYMASYISSVERSYTIIINNPCIRPSVGGGGGHLLVVIVSHLTGARCSSVVRAFAHGAMGRRIDPSWSGSIELFLVPPTAPRLV